MRLPNGFGSVTKLKDYPRRRPWVARKTIGYKENGSQINKIVGYYATKKEAIEALGQFAALPYDLSKDKLTVDQVFLKAIAREDFAYNTKYGYEHTYNKHFKDIRDIPYNKLTLEQAQVIMDSIPTGNQGNARSVFLLMERYALENGYVAKGFATFIKKRKHEIITTRIPFTNGEISALWANQGDEGAKILLLYLYTGLRNNELLALKKADIHNEGGITYLQGGSKTKAGKNRIVPIHSRIKPIIDYYMETEGEWLIPAYRTPSLLRKPLNAIYKKLNLDHCVHDCRHTFRSELDRRDANKICIDRLLGHATAGVGERVYTHKTVEELKAAIELVAYTEDI